uniref:RNase H type-1 domain-containing protein n=1 Tax=Cannabis sativa TaxID=3483 RepID=A0A803NHQ7_CANSA
MKGGRCFMGDGNSISLRNDVWIPRNKDTITFSFFVHPIFQQVVHENKILDVEGVIGWSMNFHREFVEANVSSPSSLVGMRGVTIRTLLTRPDCLKLNVDVAAEAMAVLQGLLLFSRLGFQNPKVSGNAINRLASIETGLVVGEFNLFVDVGVCVENQKIGMGALVSNRMGHVLFSSAPPYVGLLEPHVAEAKARLYGLSCCMQMGYTVITAFSDCQRVVLAVNSKVPCLNEFGIVLNDINHIRNSFSIIYPCCL